MNHNEKLLAYCLGALSGDQRFEVEESILQSRDTLIQFMNLKRSLESDEMFHVQPSSNLKSRLRRDVESTFSVKPRSIFENWRALFLKPAFGYAFVLMALISGTAILLNKPTSKTEEIKNGISVDAANQAPVTLNFL